MKKIVSIISLLVSIQILSAQTYVPFPTNNASWKETIGCSTFDISITGDTIINSKTYHALIAHEKRLHRNPTTGQCHPLGSFTMRYNIYYGAFRNDSANKQVWFVPPGKTTDTLLYEFNLSIGDTLQVGYKYNPRFSFGALYVVRIDSINLGNKWRKRFTLNDCMHSPFDSIRLIEGIGSTQTLLSTYMYCPYGGAGALLICTNEKGKTIYPDSTTSCNLITTGLEDDQIKAQELKIIPNPTQGEITISDSQYITQVQVYNLHGQKVQEFLPNQSAETQIQLDGPSGIYLIQLQKRDRSWESVKVVKR